MNKKIVVVGLGAGDIDQLPLGIYKKLIQANVVYLRTKEHPVVQELEKEGVLFRSFDSIYEKHGQFEDVYHEIAATLLESAEEDPLIYAVPGHPLVAERTVQLLLEGGRSRGIEIEIGGGQSFIDSLFLAIRIDPIEGFQLLDGTDLQKDQLQITQHIMIAQVYDQFVASNVKLTLMELLPDDYEVAIVTAAGSANEQVKKVPLFELDREVGLNNLTTVYVPPVSREEILYKQFSKLRQVIAELRGPNGCPWDKNQTHQSLKKYLIEEAYELIEAINLNDIDNIIEELGDVLLQVMLHAQIGEDEGYFSIADVIEGITAKMIRRHPHVFGEIYADTEAEVIKNWQEIKKQEKGKSTSRLAGIGKGQPNLLRASSLQKEAAKAGFDWQEITPAWEKVKEEVGELEAELTKSHPDENLMKEYGDLLFALVNVARFFDINPEEALFEANQKFIRRFSYIENKVSESGRTFEDFTLAELDFFWDEAKKAGL
ncbi:nucleoside triphosphate pyrophosphohydrolase [Bacillus sp. V3-13]|uniref:nucleoside triphosphate pyrophosphohydrolase n=1 Tax=Bacillus sp. V3-13 TaxID=2053728 RepID=UPI000C7795B4|nr:nucleoside triphosphate pyrophosphohydrolase [Bacillus sp. V3-13]PLR78931.1 nucleoside triphosphate pyrophosphohydrolase [Bacillus sp. V3-13]